MKQLHSTLIITYGILLIAGSLLYTLNFFWAAYVFAVGAILAIAQSFTYAIQNRTNDNRTARLHRLYFIATIFLGIAAALMIAKRTSWLPMMLVYVLIALFLSFRGKQ